MEFELEDDGRWIAELPRLPGVMAYGSTQAEAKVNVEILALRVARTDLQENESDWGE